MKLKIRVIEKEFEACLRRSGRRIISGTYATIRMSRSWVLPRNIHYQFESNLEMTEITSTDFISSSVIIIFEADHQTQVHLYAVEYFFSLKSAK